MASEHSKLPETQDEPELKFEGEVLIARLKLGDPDAWERFVKRYGPRLRLDIQRSLSKRQMSSDRIDDIEQEVWRFVKKYVDTFQFESDAKTRNWLTTIAYNHVRTLRHAESRGNQVSIDEIVAREEMQNAATTDRFFYQNQLYVESAEESAEATMHRAQLQRELLPILERALRELSARDREIVVRRLILKEKPADLAKRFELKTANVYQIVSRAKNSMKAYLRARGFLQSASSGE